MRNIDLIREVTAAAAGNWPYVLAGLSINVPDHHAAMLPALHVAVRIASGSTTTVAVALSVARATA
jgi:formate-dependent nitrite reductase membrane component NrfD